MIRSALETSYGVRLRALLLPGRSRVGNLPPDVLAQLTHGNGQLKDLKSRYSKIKELQHSFWQTWQDRINLTKFRGEKDYVSQAYRRDTDRRYEITFAYVETFDQLGLLDVLKEDDLFGAKLWEFMPGKPVSRDMLDSILEITFLQKVIGFGKSDSLRVLDIGAGYGRFAHRLTTAFGRSSATCIDAVATSTFLSDFYLKFRKCDRAGVVAFDRISDLKAGQYDLVTNIHSWSECTKEFVTFWLDLVADLKVPYLFIVPHATTLETNEGPNRPPQTYDDELERHGFKLVVKERKFSRSKYADAVGIFPADYRLYKRQT